MAEAGTGPNGPLKGSILHVLRQTFVRVDGSAHQTRDATRCLTREGRGFTLGVALASVVLTGATAMTVASSDARTFPPSATRSLTAVGRFFGARLRKSGFIVASQSC